MGDSNNSSRRRINQSDIDSNPCHKEQDISFQCLSRNNYIKDKCCLEFENYKQCKAFWNVIRIERMRTGVTPLMPPESERAEILRERFKGKRSI